MLSPDIQVLDVMAFLNIIERHKKSPTRWPDTLSLSVISIQ